jgi:hypothetical protein
VQRRKASFAKKRRRPQEYRKGFRYCSTQPGYNDVKFVRDIGLKKSNFLEGTETVPSRFLRAVLAGVSADFAILEIIS